MFKVYEIYKQDEPEKNYIGYTKLKLNQRFNAHVSSSKKQSRMPICHAIAKYGRDAFDIRLLFEYDNKPNAVNKEIELIASMKPRYNAHTGGTGGAMHGVMNGMFGKKWSEETRARIMKTRKTKGHPLSGTHRSDETKKKISETRKQRIYIITDEMRKARSDGANKRWNKT